MSTNLFQKCIQEVSVLWVLLASLMADETPENDFREWVCSGFFWQLGGLMSLLKMCSEGQSAMVSAGNLDCWWGTVWKCVQRVSVFWLLLASWMAHNAPSEKVSSLWVFWLLLLSWMTYEALSENVSREWVCSDSFWHAGWLMRLLLKTCSGSECVLASSGNLDANEALSKNVFRQWVCSDPFWHAGWLMRLLLKMCSGSECVLASSGKLDADEACLKLCPGSECVLASSGKLHGTWGSFWKCVQFVSVFWILLASCMADEAPS